MALINGQGFDFTSVRISMLGNTNVAGIKAITYGDTQEKNNSHGVGGEPVERTKGNVNYQGSISLTLKEVRNIIAAAGNVSLTKIPAFSIVVTYANGVDAPTVDQLMFCEFTGTNINSSSGDSEIVVELPLVIGGINFNA